jgi:hypothetical protein
MMAVLVFDMIHTREIPKPEPLFPLKEFQPSEMREAFAVSITAA